MKCFEDLFRTHLAEILGTLRLDLDAAQLGLLLRHFSLLCRWNRRINLTAIRDPRAVAFRHFGESLLAATAIPPDVRTVADIGSGAGFPGVPVAVARPELQVMLVESNGKKAAFLKEVVRGMPNAAVHAGRFEDLRLSFDCALMRAVARRRLPPDVSASCRRLVLFSGPAELEGFRQESVVGSPWSSGTIRVFQRST